MHSRRIVLVGLLATLLAMLSLTPLFAQRGANQLPPTLPQSAEPDLFDLGPLPDFSLIDQAGKSFGLHELKGKVWVADFFLTSCQGACPVMARHMGMVHQAYADNDRVQFVSMSVDPETDTGAVLADYAAAHSLDNGAWHFLTGPIGEIHRMAGTEGFKVGVPETPMAHSQRFILVDGAGHIRGYFDGMDESEMDRLNAAITALLAEQP